MDETRLADEEMTHWAEFLFWKPERKKKLSDLGVEGRTISK
jgi:rubrerythrin